MNLCGKNPESPTASPTVKLVFPPPSPGTAPSYVTAMMWTLTGGNTTDTQLHTRIKYDTTILSSLQKKITGL